MKFFRNIHTILIFGGCIACNGENKSTSGGNASSPSLINYGVVATHPHDTSSFTEGFVFYDSKLYEATGSPDDLPQTRSVVGPVELSTGKINKKVELDRNKYFGEGIVFLNDKLYQLTYKTRVGFIYDAKTFRQIKEFSFPSKEGWGLTTDGNHLIMSDGTDKIAYLDSTSLKTLKSISVYDNQGAVKGINELEYIEGFIFANVYTTNYLVKIDPKTGEVVGRIDLTSLVQDANARNRNSLDLNGIAYDSTKGTVYVTGKFWPTMYEIKFSLASN
jgi:glutamine cyclotransferase